MFRGSSNGQNICFCLLRVYRNPAARWDSKLSKGEGLPEARPQGHGQRPGHSGEVTPRRPRALCGLCPHHDCQDRRRKDHAGTGIQRQPTGRGPRVGRAPVARFSDCTLRRRWEGGPRGWFKEEERGPRRAWVWSAGSTQVWTPSPSGKHQRKVTPSSQIPFSVNTT